MFNVECLMFSEERRNIMETKMLRNIVMTMIVLLPALVNAEQLYAVNYKNTYKGVQNTGYRVQSTVGYQPSVISSQVVAPSMGFQSTSTMPMQWQQEAQEPMINADGSMNTEAYGVSRPIVGPRKINNPDEDDELENPIGDGLWALMVLAMAYAGARIWRARRMRSAEE
jgi:hypothetical protein